MWAILDNLNSTETEDVTIDSSANWKAMRPINTSGIKVSLLTMNNIWFRSNERFPEHRPKMTATRSGSAKSCRRDPPPYQHGTIHS